jgi:hypothetical protein
VIAANYEPGMNEFNLKTVLNLAKDKTLDGFYGGPNDLVVDTAHVWGVDGKGSFTAIAPPLLAKQVLLFNPDAKVPAPPGIRLERLNGVHHTNLFDWPATREFLKSLLA